MIISLLVTGYVVYLYFKLKSEAEARDAPALDAVAELKSATFELSAHVEALEKRLTAPRNENVASPC